MIAVQTPQIFEYQVKPKTPKEESIDIEIVAGKIDSFITNQKRYFTCHAVFKVALLSEIKRHCRTYDVNVELIKNIVEFKYL